MSEPKRVYIVRSNQTVNDFTFVHDETLDHTSHNLPRQHDYYALGWRRLNIIQSMPMKDTWPIIYGNVAASCSSGILGERR
jgi:hypothetical protein